MKIGIFDSGLGGLHIGHSIYKRMPEYDYLYFGDTLHVPYGRRSRDTIYNLTLNAVKYLFSQNCQIIVIACNTASAIALRQLQQLYLKTTQPLDKRILGVVVPTLEEALKLQGDKIGILATEATVSSNVFADELQKLAPNKQLYMQPAPLLVPMLEHDGHLFLDQALEHYLEPLKKENINSVILGCTHYCLLKDRVSKALGPQVNILSQDDIIPLKLQDYLYRHPDKEQKLSKEGSFTIHVNDLGPSLQANVEMVMGGTRYNDIKEITLTE